LWRGWHGCVALKYTTHVFFYTTICMMYFKILVTAPFTVSKRAQQNTLERQKTDSCIY